MDTVLHMEADKRAGLLVGFQLSFTKARERMPCNYEQFRDVHITLVDDQWTADRTAPRKAKLPPKAVAALRVLFDCLAEVGADPPPTDRIPVHTKTVTLAQWRELLMRRNQINREGNYREEFKRLHVTLTNAAAIGIWDDLVWAVT
jgi:hypothetical protein